MEGQRRRSFFKDPVALFATGLLLLFVLAAVFAPVLTPHGPNDLNIRARFLPVGSDGHPLGTDNVGRDMLARLLFGGRVSLTIGLVSTGVALLFGGILGTLAGFYPRLDPYIMRFIDVLLAIPGVLLAVAIVAILGPGLYKLMIAVGVGVMPTFARVMRSRVLPLRELEYVDAARVMGASDLRILTKCIIPNAIPPLIIYSTLSLGSAILSASILNFLGIGLDPTVAEWGAMASVGRDYLTRSPHLTFMPSLAIFVVVLAFNILGDRLRDFLDPRTIVT